MVVSPASAGASALALPVLRVEPGSILLASLQTRVPILFATHWLQRQLACAGEECPGCQISAPRVKAYAVALLEHRGAWRPVIVEGTANAWSRVDGLSAMDGMERVPGLLLRLTRSRKNSPLRIEPEKMGGPVEQQFVERRRLLSALAVLFGLPSPKAEANEDQWAATAKPAAMFALQRAIAGS